MNTAIMPLPQLSPIAAAIKALYGVASDINEFIDHHIARLKKSRNPTVARTGRVLEAAKYGFGITYISSVTIIAAGQLLLGNPLTAVSQVASAATLANPYVMTAAALGAVIYGYGALTDSEREEFHASLSKGLELGVELVKAIIRFAIETARKLLGEENLLEMKKFISEKAALFGRTLSQVTGSIVDKAAEMAAIVSESMNDGKVAVSRGLTSLKETGEDAMDAIADMTAEGKKRVTRPRRANLKDSSTG